MRQSHGRDVGCYDVSFLTKTVAKRMEFTARQTTADYVDYLSQDTAEAESLVRALRVSFSEFFRNSLVFALLEQLVLPKLIARKESCGTEIRVWSAGCADGQEAYSLAILLDELTAASGHAVPFRLIATDSSEPALAAAREGTYSAAAVGQVRLRHLARHFIRDGANYRIGFRLRERVDFSAYDLLDEGSSSPPSGIYGDFDVIVCSNVLFYYRPEVRQAILGKLQRALAAAGYLVTGEVERGIVEQTAGFQSVAPPAALFQKAPAGLTGGGYS